MAALDTVVATAVETDTEAETVADRRLAAQSFPRELVKQLRLPGY